MATVNLGRIKPVFRGAYNNSTAYVIDDIVTSGNETFIAIAATQGNATTDASKWTKLAAKGADGTDVAATLANKEIAFKTNAGALDGIPIGTAGQALKVNSGATGYEFGSAGKATEVLVNADDDVGNVANGSYFMTWNFTPTVSGKIFLSHHGSHRFAGSGGDHLYCLYEFNNGSGFITLATLGVGYATSASSHNQGWAYASVIPTTSDSDSTTVVTVTAGTQCTFRCKANSGNTANAAQDGGQDHVMSAIIFET